MFNISNNNLIAYNPLFEQPTTHFCVKSWLHPLPQYFSFVMKMDSLIDAQLEKDKLIETKSDSIMN